MSKSPIFRAALVEADQSFADAGDALEALEWVGFAAQVGEPLPPRIASWLHTAIQAFQSGAADTLDSALGLRAGGKASPRRKRREQGALQGALADMTLVHTLGATIDQAAAMVAAMRPDYQSSTLADRYRRSGFGRKATRDRSAVLTRLRPCISRARSGREETYRGSRSAAISG